MSTAQISLAILTSIITGGFVLVFVEIGNRKNREMDQFQLVMSPFMHKLSAYFKLVNWMRFNFKRNPNTDELEREFLNMVGRITTYGGKLIMSGGDYPIDYFDAKQLDVIGTDINNIWYYYDRGYVRGLQLIDIDKNHAELMDNELAEIHPKYLSMPKSIFLLAKVSGEFYTEIYKPIEARISNHEEYMSHYRRLTKFVSFAVFCVMLLLCMMLYIGLPQWFMQTSTTLIIIMFLLSMLFIGIDDVYQINKYYQLKDITHSLFKRKKTPKPTSLVKSSN